MQSVIFFSVLYRIGPPFYHGSYSVIVRTVHEGSLAEVEEYTDRKLTWTTFCGLHRVTEHVAKVSARDSVVICQQHNLKESIIVKVCVCVIRV